MWRCSLGDCRLENNGRPHSALRRRCQCLPEEVRPTVHWLGSAALGNRRQKKSPGSPVGVLPPWADTLWARMHRAPEKRRQGLSVLLFWFQPVDPALTERHCKIPEIPMSILRLVASVESTNLVLYLDTDRFIFPAMPERSIVARDACPRNLFVR